MQSQDTCVPNPKNSPAFLLVDILLCLAVLSLLLGIFSPILVKIQKKQRTLMQLQHNIFEAKFVHKHLCLGFEYLGPLSYTWTQDRQLSIHISPTKVLHFSCPKP